MQEKNNYFKLTGFEYPCRFSLPTVDFYCDYIKVNAAKYFFMLVFLKSVDKKRNLGNLT